MTDFVIARKRSLDILKDLGYEISESLPLLENAACRDRSTVVLRLLSLFAVVALSYGWDKRRGLIRDWLDSEQLLDCLTSTESRFVAGAVELIPTMQWRLETLFALAWACKITEVSLLEGMPDDLVTWFPSIPNAEPTARFRKQIELRSNSELLLELDLMYCLASAKTDLKLRGEIDKHESSPDLYTVQQRRHALEWLLSGFEWDEVELDT
ncbi:DUF4272 domain-containing protein [Massilia scottii]|uniref:DUF4272 domain-containing protein n=1 Tax=Massilia scottii TaxID=3057166 RepID=UPI002796D394|nr:DUF4272 domain-containing protein [Massilia sp. CCM 9029]MDQ1835021.1 DUF4272 domain-containing protein [Massilia sp. CCM 9029]